MWSSTISTVPKISFVTPYAGAVAGSLDVQESLEHLCDVLASWLEFRALLFFECLRRPSRRDSESGSLGCDLI